MRDEDRKSVTITCDGSSLGNGQGMFARAAVAAILSCGNVMRAVGSYQGAATNQQAEVLAACTALEALRAPCNVTLYSDSRYVVETMNGAFGRKSNEDLWERLDRAAAPHNVTWKWVRGHSKRRKEALDPAIPKIIYRQQEAADGLARAIATLGEVTDEMLAATVNKVTGQTTPAIIRAVMEGLRYLSNACDGARQLDDVGFNKFDAETGHRLASRPTLSEREVDLGRNILRKYHRQLAEYNPALLALI
jgi:ribonuclease HI